MENWGVSKIREELSDQMTFMIRCSRCGGWQEMLYPDSIGNWYDKGQKPKGEFYYQCVKCHRPLDFSEIGTWSREEPLRIHNCEWVPLKKEYYDAVTRYGKRVHGPLGLLDFGLRSYE
jgi:DNA-directed RNA polymerase subunit RPC12/RpoP